MKIHRDADCGSDHFLFKSQIYVTHKNYQRRINEENATTEDVIEKKAGTA